jgi:hypothetical protein
MALDRVKQFTLKNGEFLGSIVAQQSGYSGGMPAKMNSAGEVARAYADTGYIGIYANGSNVDKSGAPVTFYAGNGIFTMNLGTEETVYPYDSTLTYVPGQAAGIVSGLWANAGQATDKARVLAVGAVSGGVTSSLTLLILN